MIDDTVDQALWRETEMLIQRAIIRPALVVCDHHAPKSIRLHVNLDGKAGLRPNPEMIADHKRILDVDDTGDRLIDALLNDLVWQLSLIHI